MNNFFKNVIPITFESELKNSYLDYAMSVIIGRALPDVRDGLKPVHRRILFAMYKLRNDWNKIYKKSARIVGDVIGKYHPHGDAAVYETIVRMTQKFSLRYPLIDGQGNFGSIDGDSAAAMRYTEIRMSKIAHQLLEDLDKNTVNFVLNYDGTERIPDIMPAKIPNLLINGASGIAVGMATNIPPHNLKEVINGCIAYIKNKNISTEELMNYIPGPDFPTAALINGRQGIIDAYKTGRGKIFIRAKSKCKINKKTGKESIIINEIPYQVNKARILKKIVELIKEKRLEGISTVRDESDKDGMRIVIDIKKDASTKIVLNNLYNLTQLQISFGINMVALDHGQPKIMSLKKILQSFVSYRKEVITRRTIFDLEKAKQKIHILQALAITLENTDLIIDIIRSASNPYDAKKNLMSYSWILEKNRKILNTIHKNYENQIYDIELKNFIFFKKEYYLTNHQAQAILDIKLQKFTNLEKNKLLEEYKEILEKIKFFLQILKKPEFLTEFIIKELKIIKKNFGDKRFTKIINENNIVKIENLIQKEDVVITLSNNGYVKYQLLNDYSAQHRGGKGKSAVHIKKEDFIKILLIANTHDTILCFSSQGRLYWIRVYQLPLSNRISRGKPIINLLPLHKNEKITALLPVKKYKKELNILMATKYGIVKKTALTEFRHPRNTGIIAINLNKNDALIGVALTKGNNDIMLFSSYGKVVRFSEKKVRNMKRSAYGVKGIKLLKNDYVVSLIIPLHNNGMVLTITKNGYGKCTKINNYPIKSRSVQGVISIKITEKNGLVVGAVQVISQDQIMIITDAGTLLRIRVSEIRVATRNTQGVLLIRTASNETVAAIQRIVEL